MGRKVIHGMPMWSANHITCPFFVSLPLLKGVVVEGEVNVITRTARSEVRRCHENSRTPMPRQEWPIRFPDTMPALFS